MGKQRESHPKITSPSATRSIPPSLAPILSQLELESPEIVTLSRLREIAIQAGVRTAPAIVAGRLRNLGWLIPTSTRAVWEFAPGSHAGAFRHGDPYLELRAAQAVRPDLTMVVCLSSALAAQRLTTRMPDRLEIAIPPKQLIPSGLRQSARVVRFQARLESTEVDGVPVHQLTSILVHMADHPAHVRGWGAIAEVLPELMDQVTRADVEYELQDRSRATRVRLAYLIHGIDPILADHLVPPSDGGREAPRIWFGPRGQLKRQNMRFSVADTVLPFNPSRLHADQ